MDTWGKRGDGVFGTGDGFAAGGDSASIDPSSTGGDACSAAASIDPSSAKGETYVSFSSPDEVAFRVWSSVAAAKGEGTWGGDATTARGEIRSSALIDPDSYDAGGVGEWYAADTESSPLLDMRYYMHTTKLCAFRTFRGKT
jgi:hypothetical protein